MKSSLAAKIKTLSKERKMTKKTVEKKTVEKKGIFETLYDIDVTAHVEKKGSPGNQYDYLKWSVAFRILLQNYPKTTWRVLGQEEMDLGISSEAVKGFVVGTEITVASKDETVTRVETLPVTNYANQCIVNPNQMDINTAIKRCYVKTIAHVGLGMRVYENVTYPEDCADPEVKPRAEAKGASVDSPPTALPSVASVALKAAADALGDQKIPAISRPKKKSIKPVFVAHCKREGVKETDAVVLLKGHGYKSYADVPEERLGFFKSEITRLGQEQKRNKEVGRIQ